MAQLLVRNVEEEVRDRLRQRAARHGRSMEEELRAILRAASVQEDAGAESRLGSRISARFAEIGLEEDFPELRGQNARAADFQP